MSTRKGKVAERGDDVVQAEEIAASVDGATARAVEERSASGPASEIAEGALEAAAMVAEGGPVEDQPAGEPGKPVTEDDALAMVEEGEPVDESPADGEIDSSVFADTEVVEQPVESDNEVVSESRADHRWKFQQSPSRRRRFGTTGDR